MKRRTEIIIEIERVTITSKLTRRQEWCHACASDVEMISEDEAAIEAATTLRDIQRRVELRSIHSRETQDGRHLICRESLYNEHSGYPVIEARLSTESEVEKEPTGNEARHPPRTEIQARLVKRDVGDPTKSVGTRKSIGFVPAPTTTKETS